MASSKKRRSRKKAVLPDTDKPFRFMSLPPELRIMIYDVLIREQTALSEKWCAPADLVVVSHYNTTLSSSVQSLLKVKDIRAELLSRLLKRYQFEWTGSSDLEINSTGRWLSFKRYVLPFINNLTVSIYNPDNPLKRDTNLFYNILRWMRWRSLRSHLYPWQLKSLTVREVSRAARPSASESRFTAVVMNRLKDDTAWEYDVARFLIGLPMVPSLDSLKIVLKNEPLPGAAKAFLARCAACGVEGIIETWFSELWPMGIPASS